MSFCLVGQLYRVTQTERMGDGERGWHEMCGIITSQTWLCAQRSHSVKRLFWNCCCLQVQLGEFTSDLHTYTPWLPSSLFGICLISVLCENSLKTVHWSTLVLRQLNNELNESFSGEKCWTFFFLFRCRSKYVLKDEIKEHFYQHGEETLFKVSPKLLILVDRDIDTECVCKVPRQCISYISLQYLILQYTTPS